MSSQNLCTQYELIVTLLKNGNTDEVIKILDDASNESRERKAVKKMTGKEIVNLIDMLHDLNISDEKIIKIIRYIETHEPREDEPALNHNKEST